MNRRALLKGMAGLAAGALILPPTLQENVEATRRYWSLDQTMTGSWLEIPARNGWWSVGGVERWRVLVAYPDGGTETHIIDAPQVQAKLRLSRKDTVSGAGVMNADNGNLLVSYGYVPHRTLLGDPMYSAHVEEQAEEARRLMATWSFPSLQDYRP